ncbi:MAG TPA: glutamine amidotransferase [Pirellulales bacterium]|nr:glutamine amidotransferase [Pirellulales bacterium]
MLLADWSTQFLPRLSPQAALGLLVGVPVAVLLLARLLGPANTVSRKWGLWALRGTILSIVVVVLANPVRIDESPGSFERPEMFYLLDTSASMRMGSPVSRWEESLRLIERARELATASPAVPKAFRFGQRLAAIRELPELGLAPEGPNTAKSGDGDRSRTRKSSGLPDFLSDRPGQPLEPSDGDTRLLAALRQISSRFGRVPPLGIVVFSDGRAHDEAGLELLAAEFARLKTPIHVVPVGDVTKGGDVAVAAVVAPPRARKFTEVEVQVFLRSFGYDGKRCEVHLLEVGTGDRADRELAPPLPITLQSGFQSVSLSFRTETATRKLRIAIPPLPNEISDLNNQIETEMAIDRTKLRVLYVEGSSQPFTVTVAGYSRNQIRGPFSDFKQALIDDEDIECVVLARQGGLGRLLRMADQGLFDGVHGFPSTVAELAAFDAIVLSNVAAAAFTDEQLAWIEPWIGQRGGGLCMIGGENAFASGGWGETPVAAMLPVELLPAGLDWSPGETVRLAPELPPTPHAIWSLVADAKQNRRIAGSIPAVAGINRWAGARPNFTTVLATAATASAGSLPAIVAGRYGRGRTAALAFPITSPYADELVRRWGQGDNRYYAKLCRNLVYWLTENSAIGRRRLVASADKRFYRPGETISIAAPTYDESAQPTSNYRVVAMIEPRAAPGDAEPETSPLRWPSGMPRTSGEEGPFIVWGEEFDLPLGGAAAPVHAIQLPLAEVLSSGTSSQSLRVELTAYEDLTQIDSTSLDIQVLHDPFERQNPFPNHELLARLAAGSGGKVIRSAEELAAVLADVPLDVGSPIVKRVPLWSNAWVLALLLGLLTVEWCWRRALGLA